MVNNPKYIIISPVRDEEKYIEQTIKSVIKQTIKPVKWIIVDDGSSDRTPEILESYSLSYAWIKILKNPLRTNRGPGFPVIKAFNLGYESIQNENFDFIVKLDCDLYFEPDYFEKLINEFKKDLRLGIASGIYLENNGKGWRPIKMPYYHTAGACKFIKKKCFNDIGGFIPAKGWDTIDEIRAMMKGWRTKHFPNLKMYHLKKEGSGIGLLKTNIMHGEIFYITGGNKIFFIAKFLNRMLTGSPPFLSGIMLLYGYINSMLKKKQKLVNSDEEKFYSDLLMARLKRRKYKYGENI